MINGMFKLVSQRPDATDSKDVYWLWRLREVFGGQVSQSFGTGIKLVACFFDNFSLDCPRRKNSIRKYDWRTHNPRTSNCRCIFHYWDNWSFVSKEQVNSNSNSFIYTLDFLNSIYLFPVNEKTLVKIFLLWTFSEVVTMASHLTPSFAKLVGSGLWGLGMRNQLNMKQIIGTSWKMFMRMWKTLSSLWVQLLKLLYVVVFWDRHLDVL